MKESLLTAGMLEDLVKQSFKCNIDSTGEFEDDEVNDNRFQEVVSFANDENVNFNPVQSLGNSIFGNPEQALSYCDNMFNMIEEKREKEDAEEIKDDDGSKTVSGLAIYESKEGEEEGEEKDKGESSSSFSSAPEKAYNSSANKNEEAIQPRWNLKDAVDNRVTRGLLNVAKDGWNRFNKSTPAQNDASNPDGGAQRPKNVSKKPPVENITPVVSTDEAEAFFQQQLGMNFVWQRDFHKSANITSNYSVIKDDNKIKFVLPIWATDKATNTVKEYVVAIPHGNLNDSSKWDIWNEEKEDVDAVTFKKGIYEGKVHEGNVKPFQEGVLSKYLSLPKKQ